MISQHRHVVENTISELLIYTSRVVERSIPW